MFELLGLNRLKLYLKRRLCQDLPIKRQFNVAETIFKCKTAKHGFVKKYKHFVEEDL